MFRFSLRVLAAGGVMACLGTAPVALAAGGSTQKAREDSFVTVGGVVVGFIPRFVNGAVVSINLLGGVVPEAFLEYGAYKTVTTRSRRMRVGGRLLIFPGNSFYFGVGASRDSTEDRETSSSSFLTPDATSAEWNGTYEQVDAEVSIGNRWQWDSGFTLGVTWVGYSRGVQKRSSTAENAGYTDAYAEKLASDLERTSKAGGLHFTKLMIGVSL